MSAVVVYVHGLWCSGRESVLLRRRLAQNLSADSRTFSYPSVAADATTNARALAKFLSEIRADTLHLVGHSLGGVMILKAFDEDHSMRARLPPGRIVLLGSPLQGSRTAWNLARLTLGKKIMGRSVGQELLAPRRAPGERRWDQSRDVGVIAGNLGFGLGRLVGKLGGPSDGTILVEETQLEGAADRVVLRVSHTGMVFSARVARAAGNFLSTGRFNR